MAKYDKVTYKLSIEELELIPRRLRAEAKKEIGSYIKEEIISKVQSGSSPVSGENFKQLSKKYADRMKSGDRNPNLTLFENLLPAIESKNRSGNDIEIGIYKASETGKADGHNKHHDTSEEKLSKRRFIPVEGQNFKKDIINGVKSIVNNYKEEASEQEELIESIASETGLSRSQIIRSLDL